MSKKLFILSALFLTACNQGLEDAGNITFETKPECRETAVAKKYVARWKSGNTTTVTAEDRDSLIENFVAPNFEKLEFVEQDQRIVLDLPMESAALSPSDAQTEWGQFRVKAESAWNLGIDGQDIVVAVIDSGVETTHSLLNENIYVNQAEGNGSPGVDDDGNGYVDDVSGWNFIHNNPHNIDEVGHGTHVSGIIAAKHTGTIAIGVAPQATILPLDFMDQDGGDAGDAIQAIQYAARMGAKIINASWGGSICSLALKKTIQDLSQQNVLFVAAAGNSGNNLSYYPEYPAAFDLVSQITVGASTSSNYLAAFSNFGPLVDLVAPGDRIYSTFKGNSYKTLDGTSMATPFVAGVAALLWSSNRGASSSQIKNAILSGTVQGYFNVQTRGQLNVPNSLSIIN